MNITITKISQHSRKSCLFDYISNMILTKSDILNEMLQSVGFSCKTIDELVLFSSGTGEHEFVCESDIFHAYEYFIKNFIYKNKIDSYSAFKIIDSAICDGVCEKDVYRLFNSLNWTSSAKGWELYTTFKSFSITLIDLVRLKKVALNEAFLFHRQFKSGYDELLLHIPSKSSFSENTKAIRLIYEIDLKLNQKISFYIDKIKDRGIEDILSILTSLKYPHYLDARSKVDDFIKQIKLPSGVTILPDQYFEKDETVCSIKFKNLKDLDKKICLLSGNIRKITDENGFTDYLDFENIFNGDENGM